MWNPTSTSNNCYMSLRHLFISFTLIWIIFSFSMSRFMKFWIKQFLQLKLDFLKVFNLRWLNVWKLQVLISQMCGTSYTWLLLDSCVLYIRTTYTMRSFEMIILLSTWLHTSERIQCLYRISIASIRSLETLYE